MFIKKAQAQKWARQVEAGMDKGVFVSTSAAENTTLCDVIDRYIKEILPGKKSQRQVLSQFKTINKEIGHLSLSALTPSILADFRDLRLKKVKGHTVRK